MRLQLVGEIAHGFDRTGFALCRLEHGRVTQPRIERFEIRREILGIFLAGGREVATELVDARIMIMLLGCFRIRDQPAIGRERFETLRDLFQRPSLPRHLRRHFALAPHQPDNQNRDETEQRRYPPGPSFCPAAQLREIVAQF